MLLFRQIVLCEDKISDDSSQFRFSHANLPGFDRRLSDTEDGYCDEDLNNAQYQYDGGDCCWETCSSDEGSDISFLLQE